MRLIPALACLLLSTMPAIAAGPIATTESEDPGRKIEVTELKRSGDVLTLKFRLVNEADKKLDFGYDFGDGALGATDSGTIGGIHLIDEKNKKKYFVIRDEKQVCVCSRGLRSVEAKGSANLWARFPAPPEGVEKISVIVPKFLPLDDVPISK
jgi:hypothetical protein